MIVLFCLILGQISFSQIEVKYSVDFKYKKSIETENPAYFKETFKPYLNIIRISSGILYACDNQSYFSILPNSADTELRNILTQVMIERSSWVTASTKGVQIERKLNFLSVVDYDKQEWQITDDEKIIAGYKCIKATKKLIFEGYPNLNRELEVWFTPDVPINSGFRDAIGLPGLILYYNDGQWEFTAHTITTLNQCDIKMPDYEEKSWTVLANEARERKESRKKRDD
ncbi:hypothetical protein JCM19297_2405 [Nonlabens ulvanivorans]|nr:hypothetical protein JCM19297_2405 [Nonlabens ulvanivorans]